MLIAGATPYGAVGVSSSSSTTSSWMNSAVTAIQQSQNQGGIMGLLQDDASGSLGQITSFANDFATIATTSVTSAGSFYAQIASQNNQDQQAQQLQKALTELSQSQNMVQAQNVAPAIIYLGDGATLDTNANIITESDGTQYDALTGAKYVNPADLIQMANGSYLNTATNILTLTDGTQIDTVTGLKVSKTA
jgi:hypothetical protein